MSNSRECAAYFKGLKEAERCFRELRKKWRSYGRAAGQITIRDTSPEERRMIGGILGKVFYDETICFSVKEFEQGLQKTRFAPVEIKDVLEAYFGEALSTNQGQKAEEQQEKSRFWKELGDYFLQQESAASDWNSSAITWLRDMEAHKRYGYQLLLREYGRDRMQARILAENVGKALVKLEEAKTMGNESPLAVFAADISGNPHYFDRGASAGQLLVHGICYLEKAGFPENAHQWRELLLGVGIVPDNISSMVHVYGLHLRTKEGWHPAYEAFCARREPCVITMENLQGTTGVKAAGDRVYVVENEMVFSYLLEKGKELTLMCTSGQLRAAALDLLSFILDSGAEIYYSGDMDPDGLGIADRLWQKFGDRIRIWRMSPEDYAGSLSGESIGTTGMARLENICNPILQKTAACMKEKRVAAYQENLLKSLLEDIGASL
ncbi:MAG: TIGR02679 family protein [Butyrivibrio sp.]|nr:TIGR02679 family protein [Acetatifactor muris]MCM1559000.1 TIGR02679 family protein [Butyrivibrio sp.]